MALRSSTHSTGIFLFVYNFFFYYCLFFRSSSIYPRFRSLLPASCDHLTRTSGCGVIGREARAPWLLECPVPWRDVTLASRRHSLALSSHIKRSLHAYLFISRDRSGFDLLQIKFLVVNNNCHSLLLHKLASNGPRIDTFSSSQTKHFSGAQQFFV